MLNQPTDLSTLSPDSFVEYRLKTSQPSPLYDVAVTCVENGVRLSGIVPTYFLKQKAQCLALETEGVESIVNDIVVRA